MSDQRFEMPMFVEVLLRRGARACFLRRANTKYDAGFYGIPGGGVEAHETVRQAAVREIWEELGVIIRNEDLRMLHVVHATDPRGGAFIQFLFEADVFEGQPCIMEPDKADDLAWLDVTFLPVSVVPLDRYMLQRAVSGEVYSEFGW